MTWQEFILNETKKPYFAKIKENLKNEHYPKDEEIFRAFMLTPYEKIKAVLIGQDPYHQENQAHGLAFSVSNQVPPPSLKNILLELENEYNLKRTNTDLSDWAKQGVLLINIILTVEKGKPKSHANIGWEIFTANAIKEIEKKKEPLVYILLGKTAQSIIPLITNPKHYLLTSSHPSFFSAKISFFGSNIFKKTNEILTANNIEPIKWI